MAELSNDLVTPVVVNIPWANWVEAAMCIAKQRFNVAISVFVSPEDDDSFAQKLRSCGINRSNVLD
jgi:hypothetical protein